MPWRASVFVLFAMYIDIFLALVLAVVIYTLWRRISEKIPDLEMIPDQELSVLLEENTAKLQRFFLHLFHFRSFYRERRYHANIRMLVAKLLFKLHIFLLRADNGIMRAMKRMRSANEIEGKQEADARGHAVGIQIKKERSLPVEVPISVPASAISPQIRMQEVRPRRRALPRARKINNPEARFADERMLP